MRVNDRVELMEDADTIDKGKVGTVIQKDMYCVCVEFDDDIDGHAGEADGLDGKSGHCWYIKESSLKVIRTPAVGDRIISKERRKTVNGFIPMFARGKILLVDEDDDTALVEFDYDIGGHEGGMWQDLGCKDGHTWWLTPDQYVTEEEFIDVMLENTTKVRSLFRG